MIAVRMAQNEAVDLGGVASWFAGEVLHASFALTFVNSRSQMLQVRSAFGECCSAE
jgi:hypothetical protein